MVVIPELLAHDEAWGRDLYLLQVSRPEGLMPVAEALGPFVCLLLWDASAESVDVVSRVAECLLGSGCVYLCAWGADCERVHDIFDEVIVGDGTQVAADEPHVMTTWHDGESLDDAIWFFLRSAYADERLKGSCRSSIAIVVGDDDERSAAVRRALAEPAEFSRRVEEAQE